MKKRHIILFLFLIFFFVGVINKNSIKNLLRVEKNPKVVLERLIQNKPGIYVFGFEDCPWCKRLYPILDETLNYNNESSYSVDTHKDDFRENERYLLKNYIEKNTNFDDIIVPLVILISEDGYYQYHVGTVEGHNASKNELNEFQEQELRKKLESMIFEYKKHNKIGM